MLGLKPDKTMSCDQTARCVNENKSREHTPPWEWHAKANLQIRILFYLDVRIHRCRKILTCVQIPTCVNIWRGNAYKLVKTIALLFTAIPFVPGDWYISSHFVADESAWQCVSNVRRISVIEFRAWQFCVLLISIFILRLAVTNVKDHYTQWPAVQCCDSWTK
jgi:hypothetical protein